LELLLDRKLATASEVRFLSPGLHVNLDSLRATLEASLLTVQDSTEPLVLLYGNQCHPDIGKIGEQYGAEISRAKDCIGILLGEEELANLSAEARTFYLTPGWLDNWEVIFREGLGWDEVDARQNFGIYERVMLLDTGVMPLDEERILSFFDYCGIPIEIHQVSLDKLAAMLNQELRQLAGSRLSGS
jgi:hypothetical protein